MPHALTKIAMTTYHSINSAALILGIVGLSLLWKYGDVLFEIHNKPVVVGAKSYESFARCGLGFLIFGLALHVISRFL